MAALQRIEVAAQGDLKTPIFQVPCSPCSPEKQNGVASWLAALIASAATADPLAVTCPLPR